MRRYERREVPAVKSVEVEARCDRCGVLEADADMAWLCPVVIEVNLGEEGGRRDEYDYCNDCLIEMADALVAAGSKAFLVTGVEIAADDD